MSRVFATPNASETSSMCTSDEADSQSEEGASQVTPRRSHSEPFDLHLLPQDNLLAQQRRLRVETLESQESASQLSPSGHIDALTEDIGAKILAGKWPVVQDDSDVSRSSSIQQHSPAGGSSVIPPWSSPGYPGFYRQPNFMQAEESRIAETMVCARCHRRLNEGEPAYLQRQPHIGQVTMMCKSCHEEENEERLQRQIQNARPASMARHMPTTRGGENPREDLSPLRWHIEHERRRLLGSPVFRLASWPQSPVRRHSQSSSDRPSHSEHTSKDTSGSEMS